MKKIYPACFYKEDNGYSVIFPDLDIATCGSDLENALNMAEDLLCMYILDSISNKEHLKEPSNISDIVFDDEIVCTEKFTNLVIADIEKYKDENKKSVKKTLSIPSWLNNLAENEGLNFSKTLQDALIEKLGV